MNGPRIRALVLAAGLGERLRPLTGLVPKPLLPAVGQCVAAYSLRELRRIGCEAAALNLHHLGDRVRAHFGASWDGLPLHYSEEDELLGTLGALRPLRSFFADCDIGVVLNGDTLCRWPLRSLLREHLRTGAEATFLVTRRVPPELYGGGIGLDAQGRVVQFRRTGPAIAPAHHRRVFAGAHLMSRAALDRIPEGDGPADLMADLYQPRLARGDAVYRAVESRRAWHDLGTPRRYLDGVVDWSRGRAPFRWVRHSWISADARVHRSATVRASAVEGGARIEAKARVERSLLMAGARVGEGCRLQGVIVGPGVAVPAGSRVHRQMVTPLAAGRAGGVADSVLGQLVFTPID